MNKFDEVKTKVKKKLEESSYPVKPKSFGKKYSFPEDLTKLTGSEIGQWMAMLAAYRGYVVRQIGLAQIDRNIKQSSFDFELRQKIKELDDGKSTRTALKDKALESFDTKEILMANQMCQLYETLARIYDGQLEILSREISRRKGEM